MDCTVLWEDENLLLALKPAGVVSEAVPGGMPSLVGAYLSRRDPNAVPYVGVVHRLDREAAGVMAFAKNEKTAAALSACIADRSFSKTYLAVVCGKTPADGEMTDLLYHDRSRNKTYTVDRKRRGVREARLSYRTLAVQEGKTGVYSLVEVALHTGRTHQIRVQFASRKFPLLGDAKYGGEKGKMALWSYRIAFTHPFTGEALCVTALPEPTDSWSLFSDVLEHRRNVEGAPSPKGSV